MSENLRGGGIFSTHTVLHFTLFETSILKPVKLGYCFFLADMAGPYYIDLQTSDY